MSELNSTRVIVTAVAAAFGMIGAVGLFVYQKMKEQQQNERVRRDLDKIGESMAELQAQLDNLRMQQNQRRNRERTSRRRQTHKNSSAYSVTDDDTDVDAFSTADTDFDDDEFFDFSDMESDGGDGDNERLSGPTNELDRRLAETDELTESTTATGGEEALSILRNLLVKYPDNLEVIWRLARACHKSSTNMTDDAKKKAIIVEGIKASERFEQSDSGDFHKWYAILIGSLGMFLPTKEKIESGHRFRKHVDRALELSPNDPALYHLLGRFKYEVASLTWIERKLASTLFAEPPSATYDEAIIDFERAEKLTEKPFKGNKLLLGKSYIAVRKYEEAVRWLEETIKVPSTSEEDRISQTEADQLLSKSIMVQHSIPEVTSTSDKSGAGYECAEQRGESREAPLAILGGSQIEALLREGARIVMRALLRGALYCALWYGSIVAGFLFIACPLLPVLLLSPLRFRKCADLLFSCWELYPTGLLEMFGVKVLVSGDHISPYESAILVMNHRTRVDWNFLWAAMYQACMPEVAAHKLKFILKDPIRHIPGPGWVMQMNGFLYITRHWEEDRGRLSGSLDYLVALGRRCQLLIFPEGTDLTPDSKQKSDNYAAKHGLPKYNYTLHPKTTGFSYLARHLHQAQYLDAVYDLTIAYPDYVPQSEVDLVRGKLPKEVHFHVKRIPATDVPKDDLMLRQWLENRWHHKEATLEQFSEGKAFPAKIWPMASLFPLRAAIGFWSFLTGATVLLLVVSPLFQLWALVHSALFIGLSFFSTGFNQMEMGWYWRWKAHA